MFNKIKNWLFHEDLKKQNLAAFIMLLGSGLGLLASFVLSIEALELAKNSHAVLSCDFSSALSCSAVAVGGYFRISKQFHRRDDFACYGDNCSGVVGGSKVPEVVHAGDAGWCYHRNDICYLDVLYELRRNWRALSVVFDLGSWNADDYVRFDAL